MDTMKQMQRTVLPLLMLCGLAACSDDDWKDDVAALQEPTPTSIVIMDNAGGTVVKGNRFQVRFRVNPSGTQLTKDNVELDVQNSDTYFLYEEEGNNAAKTRASYVEPSDYYALESVEPDKNEAGETLDGQWIATIQTQGEANFRNVANLHFVINYTDAAGTPRRISSDAVPVEIVPTVDEGIRFEYAKVQSLYYVQNNEVKTNPYALFDDINAYRNAQGMEWHYNRNYVTEIKTALDKDVLQADTTAFYSGGYMQYIPVTNAELWTSVTNGTAKKASTDVQVTLIDFGGTTKTLDLPVTYCYNILTLDIPMSASEINAVYETPGYMFEYDLSEALSEYGITPDAFALLSRFSPMNNVIGSDEHIQIPAVIEEVVGLTDRQNFKPVIQYAVLDELTPGESTDPDTEADIASIFITSSPQESDKFWPMLSITINLAIHITE